jgi:gliding motility-associated-like protein
LTIKAKPVPASDFRLDRSLLCTGDTLSVSWTAEPSAERYLIIGNSETKLPNSGRLDTSFFRSGKITLCMRAEKESCTSVHCDSVEIRNPLPVPTGQCVSTDSSVLFFWNDIAGSGFEVLNLSGQSQGIPLSDTSYFFSGLARGEEVKIRITRKDSICGDQSIELKCNAVDCPDRNILNRPELSVCLDNQTDTILIGARIDSGPGDGSWHFSGPGIIDSTLGVFDPVKSGRGIHAVQIEYREGTCLFRSQVLIRVRPKPVASFELDSLICLDSFVLVRFTGRKEDTTFSDWQSDGGFIRQAGKDLFEFKWDKPGKKKIKLRLPEEFCQDEQERITEVLPPLEKPEISCSSTDTSVTFFWKKNPRARNYLIFQDRGPAGTRTSDTSFQIRIFKPGDTAAIRLRIFDNGPCGEVESDAIQCIAPECPPLNILKDTTLRICANQLAPVLLGSLVNSPDTGYQFSGPQLSGDTVRFENIGEGAHVYQLRLRRGSCSYEDSIVLIKMAVPKIEQISITPIPCLETDSTGAIEITRVSGNKTSYSIDGSPYTSSGRFDPVSAGPHLLAVIDSNGCRSDTLVLLVPPEHVDIELGQDLEVNRGSLVEINSSVTGKYARIIWTGYNGLDCDSCKKVSFRTDKDLTLVAQVSNEYGCTDVDEIKILVRDKRIYAPSSFSPNGDRVNDGFTIYGPDDNVLINRLEIFDRWGAQIYLGLNLPINDPQNGWNGEFRGQKLMPGVYVYVARVIFEDGSSQHIRGEVTLIR